MQASAAKQAAADAQKRFEQQRQDLAPFRDAATAPLQAQQDLLGLNGQPAADAAMANYQTSPGYQWQMSEGLRGVDAGAAARGMLRSGATIKGEEQFAQGLANSDFGTYYNRLMGLSTLGENAAAGGASTANTAGAAAQSAGNTQASIYGNTFGGFGNSVNTLLQNPNVQSTLKGWFSSPTATDPINS
ncbi:MAG TPA: hypothetical protein VNM37_08575 [Candidatus Dormibacteraeota bacterium]|nr:hypothetical protein [Candidatus Dormibacteraeota bacterium]